MNRFNKKDSIYLIISLLIVTFDYIIKLKVKNNMNVGESINVVGNFFKITYIQNKGAAFGMLQEQQSLFLIVGLITIVFLFNLFLKTKDRLEKIKVCDGVQITSEEVINFQAATTATDPIRSQANNVGVTCPDNNT